MQYMISKLADLITYTARTDTAAYATIYYIAYVLHELNNWGAASSPIATKCRLRIIFLAGINYDARTGRLGPK